MSIAARFINVTLEFVFLKAEEICSRLLNNYFSSRTVVRMTSCVRSHSFAVVELDRQIVDGWFFFDVGPIAENGAENIDRAKAYMAERQGAVNQSTTNDEKKNFQPSDSCSRMSKKLKSSLYDRIQISLNHAASSGGPRRARQPMAAVNVGRLGAGMAIAAA